MKRSSARIPSAMLSPRTSVTPEPTSAACPTDATAAQRQLTIRFLLQAKDPGSWIMAELAKDPGLLPELFTCDHASRIWSGIDARNSKRWSHDQFYVRGKPGCLQNAITAAWSRCTSAPDVDQAALQAVRTACHGLDGQQPDRPVHMPHRVHAWILNADQHPDAPIARLVAHINKRVHVQNEQFKRDLDALDWEDCERVLVQGDTVEKSNAFPVAVKMMNTTAQKDLNATILRRIATSTTYDASIRNQASLLLGEAPTLLTKSAFADLLTRDVDIVNAITVNANVMLENPHATLFGAFRSALRSAKSAMGDDTWQRILDARLRATDIEPHAVSTVPRAVDHLTIGMIAIDADRNRRVEHVCRAIASGYLEHNGSATFTQHDDLLSLMRQCIVSVLDDPTATAQRDRLAASMAYLPCVGQGLGIANDTWALAIVDASRTVAADRQLRMMSHAESAAITPGAHVATGILLHLTGGHMPAAPVCSLTMADIDDEAWHARIMQHATAVMVGGNAREPTQRYASDILAYYGSRQHA